MAVLQLVKKLIDRKQLARFAQVRRDFESFLMAHKEAFTLVVKRQGSGHRSLPALESFLDLAMTGLWGGKEASQIIEDMAKDQRFSFFATTAPIRNEGTSDRNFSKSVKSAAFVAELAKSGIRCAICGGLLHRNSMHSDHVVRKADGGSGHSSNAQLTHPNCNSAKPVLRHAAVEQSS
jgi:hypothetical protein